ncbi:MAG TPA: SUF system NifU family Fe-S cluster assembly protein [Thermoanaerobaculia bacterium]|jgi:nitrogen fixation NifU-like protein|nr:SUF system NifU family Fe-S cluster assembly protein [Thermoanaerobaculia bacterium]
MSDTGGDLRDLYQDVILDHNRRPRNFGELPGANRRAEGHNPLCGDRVAVFVEVDAAGDRIRDIAFQGSGCAISTASASLMTEALKGKSLAEARELFHHFHALVTRGVEGDIASLGKLAAFAGVSEFPMRVKCATLAWHALQSALDRPENPPVPTESETE